MNHARRPHFTDRDLKKVISGLRKFERTGTKRRTQEIRKLLRDYVHFVLLTGARAGTELSNLRWTDIDTFEQGGKGYVAVSVDGKTGQRELVASPRLTRYLDRLARRNCSGSEKVFVLPDGTQPRDLHGAFEIFLKSINLTHNKQGKRYSLYSLRHTYATQRLTNGVGMHLLARQMGTSTVMLEQHYSHFVPRMNAVALVGNNT